MATRVDQSGDSVMIYRIQDTNTDWLYEHGVSRGVDIGFDCMKDMFSIKKGYPLFIMAAPRAGKTEFTLELLMNLSIFYGWKHCIFTPETGEPREVAAELCAKFIGKDFYDTYNNQMDLSEKYRAEQFLNEHFIIIDSGSRMTVEDFYAEVDKCEKECDIKFDTVTIDPWNKVKHEKAGRRDDEYLEDVLNDIILNGRKHKRVNIIAQHCRDQPPITKGGFTYYPMPTARDFAGGQVWFRMGFMMLGLWRPPTHIEFNGVMYDPNTLMVDVQKQKPNGISTPGFYETKALLYYEPKTHRYYEQLGTSTSYAKKRREEPENQEPPQMVL